MAAGLLIPIFAPNILQKHKSKEKGGLGQMAVMTLAPMALPPMLEGLLGGQKW